MSHDDVNTEPAYVTRIESKIDHLSTLLSGGSEPSRGVIVRLDRMEQSEQRRDYWSKTAIGAAITAIVGSVWAILTKQH